MKKIDIDISKTRNVNYNISPIVSSVSAQRRNVNLLKWRISPDVQNRRNISSRLNAAVSELESIEKKLNEIYRITESALDQFAETENKLNKNADAFL